MSELRVDPEAPASPSCSASCSPPPHSPPASARSRKSLRTSRPPNRVKRRKAYGTMFKDCEPSSSHSGACVSHIDPRKLIGCSTSSYCCSATCGPPSKRRATQEEVARLDQPAESQPALDDCDSLWEHFCSGFCDDVCTSPPAVSCSGGDECTEQNACYDPNCEGTPCFAPDCTSEACTEPSCPDNHCQTADPCYNEHCSLDYSWDGCPLSHSDFHGNHFHHDAKWPAQSSSDAMQQSLAMNNSFAGDLCHLHNFSMDDDFHKSTNHINPSILHAVFDPSDGLLPQSDQLFAAASLADLQHTAATPFFGNQGTLQNVINQGSQPSLTSPPSLSPPSTTSPPASSPHPHLNQPSPAWPHPHLTQGSVCARSQSHLRSFPELDIVDTIESSLEASSAQILARQPLVAQDAFPSSSDEFVCKWVVHNGSGQALCKARCSDSLELQKHIRDVHLTNRLDEYRCQWLGCPNTNDFKLRSKLERHMQTHSKYRPHTCDWPGCGKSFGTKQTLDNHLKTHTQLKPYKCRFCDATATTQTQIKTHENSVHEKKKLFPCRFPGCMHVATDSSNLSKHEKTHKGWARTFYCPEPGCTYKPDCRWENLKRHWVKTGHCAYIMANPELQNQFREQCNERAKSQDLSMFDFVDKTLGRASSKRSLEP